jgi:hypothetical protein
MWVFWGVSGVGLVGHYWGIGPMIIAALVVILAAIAQMKKGD